MEAHHPGGTRCVEQRLGSQDVRAEETGGIDDRERVVRLRGEVDHDLGPVLAQRGVGELAIADVPLHEPDAILDG